jgi:hypothetical protein
MKICEKGVKDKKCQTAIEKLIERNKTHHTKHHTKHNLKKHHRHKKHTHKPHQTIVNIFNGVAEQTSKAQPTPNPPPTGQGIHADVPYSNLVNQRKVYERRFEELEKRKRQTDAHSRFKDFYDAEQGEQDFRPEKKDSGTDPRKAGRPSLDEIKGTRARDINDPTDEGEIVYEQPPEQPPTSKKKRLRGMDEGGGAGKDMDGEL